VHTTQSQVIVGLQGSLFALKILARIQSKALCGAVSRHAAQAALGVTLFSLWWGFAAFSCSCEVARDLRNFMRVGYRILKPQWRLNGMVDLADGYR